MMLPPENPATWAEGNLDRAEEVRRVFGYRLHGEGSCGHYRPPRSTVVEGEQAIAVREPAELELPGLHGVAQSADEQGVRFLARLFGPEVEFPGADMRAHF